MRQTEMLGIVNAMINDPVARKIFPQEFQNSGQWNFTVTLLCAESFNILHDKKQQRAVSSLVNNDA